MAKGKPSKWITAYIERPLNLGKDGIHISVWRKYGREKQGDAYISVGGIWWKFPKKRHWRKLSWDELNEIMRNR